MARELEHELVSNDRKPGPLGRVWWDGKKVAYSNDVVRRIVSDMAVDGRSVKDGKDFLKVFARHFKSGYITIKRVK